MKVLSLSWLGMRTKNFAAMSALFENALGLEVQSKDQQSSRFVLADKSEVHVYDNQDEFHEFFGDAPVIGFEVDSFAQARAKLYQIEEVRRTSRLKEVSTNTVFDRYGAIRVFCGLHSI